MSDSMPGTFGSRINAYEKLVRLDKPIGILLLLWPTLWAIWIASRRHPNVWVVWIFILGTVLMRSAGCAVNDWADRNYDREVAKVRVLSSLKEPAPWLAGAIVSAYPFPGNEYDSPPWEAEHLATGGRFIVFPIGNDRRDQMLRKDSPIQLEWCGVQEDTPEVRRDLEKGFAQNDTLDP